MDVQTELQPTWRDKFYVHIWYPIRYGSPPRIQQAIAHKMPRWLVYFVTIRAYSDAWANAGNKTPNELTFDEVIKPWEKTRP